jgi:hypothetical protein
MGFGGLEFVIETLQENGRLREKNKRLVEALKRIGALSESSSRSVDDYGEIARKTLSENAKGE